MQNHWRKQGMVFSLKDHAPAWVNSHAMMPTPLLLEKTIRVYFTARDISGVSRIGFVDLDRNDPTKIMYVHDKPLLDIGAAGAFDDSGTIGVFVMHQGDKIYLYYNGYNIRVKVPWSNAVGLAVSSDGGASFEKAFAGPVLDRSKDEPYFVITPWIMNENGNLRMWYTSGTGWLDVGKKVLEPIYEIKYAESNDGIEWKRNNHTCIHPLDAEEANARAAVVKRDGVYHMWFIYRGSRDFRDGTDGYRIGYAHSSDGLSWVRDDHNSGMVLGGEGEWDSLMQAYPAVLEVDGKLLMFYNGNGFGRDGFGVAVWDGK